MPGFAQQTGKAAFDAWIDASGGANSTVTFEAAREAGNVLIVEELEISSQTSIAFAMDQGKQSVATILFNWNAPELAITELVLDGQGLSAESLEHTEAVALEIEVAIDDAVVLTYQGEIENYVLTGVFLPSLPAAPATLKGATREWVTWLESLADIKIDAVTIESMSVAFATTGDLESVGAVSAEIDINDFALKGMWDGRVAQYSVGEVVQETKYTLEDGQPYAEKTTIDSTQAKNLDFLAFLELFDPKPYGSSDYVQVVESATLNGYRIESDLFEVIIDRVSYENFAVRSPETDLIAFAETLLSGEEPDTAAAMVAVLDMYRSFAFGDISLEDFLVGYDAEPEIGSGGIGKISISNLSSDGLEEFLMETVDFDAGEQGKFRIDRFAIANVEFPPYPPIKRFAQNSAAWENPDPLEVTRLFSPLSIATELRGLAVVSPELPGEFSIENYLLDLKTTVPPIPTHIVLTTEGLEFPVAMLDDKEAEAMLQAAGIDVLRLTERITLDWDEATEDLILDKFVVELGNVGRVRARARLGGLPKSVLQNPLQAQAAIATLNIKSLEIELENIGGVESALALAAMDAGVSEGMMKEALLMQLDGALKQIGNDAFSGQVMTAARAFFDNPKKLKITVAPGDPVPVSQIMSDAMIAPDALPERLGVVVEANR